MGRRKKSERDVVMDNPPGWGGRIDPPNPQAAGGEDIDFEAWWPFAVAQEKIDNPHFQPIDESLALPPRAIGEFDKIMSSVREKTVQFQAKRDALLAATRHPDEELFRKADEASFGDLISEAVALEHLEKLELAEPGGVSGLRSVRAVPGQEEIRAEAHVRSYLHEYDQISFANQASLRRLWVEGENMKNEHQKHITFRNFINTYRKPIVNILLHQGHFYGLPLYKLDDTGLIVPALYLGQFGRYVRLRVRLVKEGSTENEEVELFLCALYKAYLENPHARPIFDSIALGLDLPKHRLLLLLWLTAQPDRHPWRGIRKQAVYVFTPDKYDLEQLLKIVREGPQAAFSDTFLAIYIGMTALLAVRAAAHLNTNREAVNSRITAMREVVPLGRWTMAPVFLFETHIESLSLHFVESFTNVVFGATDADSRGLNFNQVDKAVRECLLPTPIAAKAVVAFERLLEDFPEEGFIWPAGEDKEGWEALLKPALPNGLPCSPITVGLLFSGHRRYVARATSTPLVDAIASKRTRSGWYEREDGEGYRRLPASPEHLVRQDWGSMYKGSSDHPTTILSRLCELYHPRLKAELQLPDAHTSRDLDV